MYKFPDDFDGRAFVGRTLEMICFNANQVYLHFDKKVSICAESSFLLSKHSSDEDRVIVSIPLKNSEMVELLDHSVTEIAISDRRNLTLRFDHGQSLSFVDQSELYESFRFVIGDTTIIV
jgi:hypothetical protein